MAFTLRAIVPLTQSTNESQSMIDFPLTDANVIMGRSPEFGIDDPHVSRCHALFRVDSGCDKVFVLAINGKQQLIHVNGRPLDMGKFTELALNDTICLLGPINKYSYRLERIAEPAQQQQQVLLGHTQLEEEATEVSSSSSLSPSSVSTSRFEASQQDETVEFSIAKSFEPPEEVLPASADLVASIVSLLVGRTNSSSNSNSVSTAFLAFRCKETVPHPGLLIKTVGGRASPLMLYLPASPEQLAGVVSSKSTAFFQSEDIEVSNAAFAKMVQFDILPDALQALDLSASAAHVSLKLQGLSIDMKRKALRSSHPADGSTNNYFAHLHVELPAVYAGGGIKVIHDSRLEQVDYHSAHVHTADASTASVSLSAGAQSVPCNTCGYSTKFWATYAGCEVKMAPITDGCRLRLLYGLKWNGSSPAPQASLNTEILYNLKSRFIALQDAVLAGELSTSHAIMGAFLAEEYSAGDLSKGFRACAKLGDKALLGFFEKLNEVLPAEKRLVFHVVTVTRTVSEPGGANEPKERADEDEDDYSGRYGGYRYRGYRRGYGYEREEVDIDEYEDDDFIPQHEQPLDDDDDDEDNDDDEEDGEIESIKLSSWYDCHGKERKSFSTKSDPLAWGLNICSTTGSSRPAAGGTEAAADGGGGDGGNEAMSQMDDDEVQFIPGPDKQLPHIRPECRTHLFSKESKPSNNRYCDSCYCYICDGAVTSCVDWKAHCDAHASSQKWSKVRDAYKSGRAAGRSNKDIYDSRVREGKETLPAPVGPNNVFSCKQSAKWELQSKKVEWQAWNDAQRITSYKPRQMLVMWPQALTLKVLGLRLAIEFLAGTSSSASASSNSSSSSSSSASSFSAVNPKHLTDIGIPGDYDSLATEIVTLWDNEGANLDLVPKMLEALGKVKNDEIIIQFLQEVFLKCHKGNGKALGQLLITKGWSENLVKYVQHNIADAGVLEVADAEQFALICIENKQCEIVGHLVETLVASLEMAPTGSLLLLSLPTFEAVLALKDAALIDRIYNVLEKRTVAAREHTSHPTVKAALENMRQIQQLGQKPRATEEAQTFCRRIKSLLWDMHVSEMCLDPAYSWQSLNANDLSDIYEVGEDLLLRLIESVTNKPTNSPKQQFFELMKSITLLDSSSAITNSCDTALKAQWTQYVADSASDPSFRWSEVDSHRVNAIASVAGGALLIQLAKNASSSPSLTKISEMKKVYELLQGSQTTAKTPCPGMATALIGLKQRLAEKLLEKYSTGNGVLSGDVASGFKEVPAATSYYAAGIVRQVHEDLGLFCTYIDYSTADAVADYTSVLSGQIAAGLGPKIHPHGLGVLGAIPLEQRKLLMGKLIAILDRTTELVLGQLCKQVEARCPQGEETYPLLILVRTAYARKVATRIDRLEAPKPPYLNFSHWLTTYDPDMNDFLTKDITSFSKLGFGSITHARKWEATMTRSLGLFGSYFSLASIGAGRTARVVVTKVKSTADIYSERIRGKTNAIAKLVEVVKQAGAFAAQQRHVQGQSSSSYSSTSAAAAAVRGAGAASIIVVGDAQVASATAASAEPVPASCTSSSSSSSSASDPPSSSPTNNISGAEISSSSQSSVQLISSNIITATAPVSTTAAVNTAVVTTRATTGPSTTDIATAAPANTASDYSFISLKREAASAIASSSTSDANKKPRTSSGASSVEAATSEVIDLAGDSDDDD